MKKSRVRFGNRGLLILLGVLCVAIVGLGVGIVFVRSSNDEVVETKSDEDIINDILDTIEPMSIEDTLLYLDEQLSIYNGTNLASAINMMKLNACINAEQFSDAVMIAGEIDEQSLDSSEKLNLYSALDKAYTGLGDMRNADYYSNKFVETYYEIIGEDEGNNE